MFIADWWNFIYSDLLGESAVLMALFGWEVFLLPLFFLGTVAGALGQGFIEARRN